MGRHRMRCEMGGVSEGGGVERRGKWRPNDN